MENTNRISYHSKLVGVSFEGRPEIISTLKGEEPLRFRREPENEYDSNAVAIDVLIGGDWKQIGYIAKDKNSELAEVLDAGKSATIKISEITGGGEKAYGVNVYIEYERARKPIRSPYARRMKDIFGNEIFYDDIAHQYTNALGEVYLSGSKYASSFEKPFDAKLISGKMANKAGLPLESVQHIQDMWELKSKASKEFGSALHSALELYGRYKGLSEKLGKETHLHDNAVLYKAVSSFYAIYPDVKNVGYECLVVDHKKKRAGRIDRLERTKEGYYIADFKSNFDIKKSLSKYWLQLSFYAAILKANGVKVAGLKIYHYTGEEWVTINGEVIDIDEGKK